MSNIRIPRPLAHRPGRASQRRPGGARLLLAPVLLTALVACQQEPQAKPGAAGNGSQAATKRNDIPNFPLTPDAMRAIDPCAERLQDIEGALLNYFLLNKHLPQKLDELKSLADFGTQLNFTCPVSKKPYVYSPAGLEAAGRAKRIYVHDPEPSHEGGKRWCIMMPPVRPGQQPFMEVLLLDDKDFRSYLPISQINP
jgi:hypothetical protein